MSPSSISARSLLPRPAGRRFAVGGMRAKYQALNEEQRAAGAAFAELLLGDCPYCRGRFHVVEAALGDPVDAEVLLDATATDQSEQNVPAVLAGPGR